MDATQQEVELFWDRVGVGDDEACWEWSGRKSPYGHFGHRGKSVVASRFAWEITNGPIPHGMIVCHRCDNPPCCNPAHLFLGTPRDNVLDRIRKGRNNYQRGERHGQAKLTLEQVVEIRLDVSTPQRELAVRYGVSQTTIGEAQRGRTWSWVEENKQLQVRKRGRSGTDSPISKLNDDAVRNIRATAGATSALAKLYGVSKQTVKDVRTGRTWKHVA